RLGPLVGPPVLPARRVGGVLPGPGGGDRAGRAGPVGTDRRHRPGRAGYRAGHRADRGGVTAVNAPARRTVASPRTWTTRSARPGGAGSATPPGRRHARRTARGCRLSPSRTG